MGISLAKELLPGKFAQSLIRRKRKRDEDDDSEGELNCAIEETLHTPKRKRLVTTAQYIYRALFKEGRNSDISVVALGREWKLHKIYLCQSPYFSSMFGGSWIESGKKHIAIKIVDNCITEEALDIVFGSLYLDNVTLEPSIVVSTLAAASLFQLDGLIGQCAEIMTETLNPRTAVSYYEAAREYGVKKVEEACFEWLLVNLLYYYNEHPKRLCELSPELMSALVANPNLFVIQTEFSAYLLLKVWVYRHENPEWDRTDFTMQRFEEFFAQRTDPTPYLLTMAGRKYADPFRALRMRHLVLCDKDIESIRKDNILPPEWLSPAICDQWRSLLKISQNDDRGPKEITDEVFLANCVRCGRVLNKGPKHMWRWTGFHFGLDLLIIADGRSLWLKRNHRPENEQLLSFQVDRHVVARVSVASLDEQKQIGHKQTTSIQRILLSKNQEHLLLTLDKEITYPLLFSINFMITSP